MPPTQLSKPTLKIVIPASAANLAGAELGVRGDDGLAPPGEFAALLKVAGGPDERGDDGLERGHTMMASTVMPSTGRP